MEAKKKHLETQNEVDNSVKAEFDNVETAKETAQSVSDDAEIVNEVEVNLSKEEDVDKTSSKLVSDRIETAEPVPISESVSEVEVKEEIVEISVPEIAVNSNEPKADEIISNSIEPDPKVEAVNVEAESVNVEAKAEENITESNENEAKSTELTATDDLVETVDPINDEPKDETDEAENEDDEETKIESLQLENDEPEVDYSQLTEVELINELRNLLDTRPFMEIYRHVDLIKINFYKKNKIRITEQKKAFIAEGGIEEEFKPEGNPYEQDLKNMLDEFRQKKAIFNKDVESEKEQNVQKKYEIIEEIKNLVNRKESINRTFQDFKDLQQRWREVGLVPQANMKDLWENYHHHVENFYDYIKINKELRDLDLKKNMEEKITLCEKAEELLLEPSIIKAFNILQKLHDEWREVGPVPREQKEELWERFKEATTKINKKHQDFFENRKKAQKKNLDAKSALCEKVEEILEQNLDSHKDWEDKSKELVELQKYWRTIGFTPKKENNIIYERFRITCDRFFDKKREFYAKHKEIQSNNLQMKIDLCVQAEALKDSTDWKKTTDEFIAIQKKWKEIGPIPRKHSDIIWKRFRAACDNFFENKSKYFNTKDESQTDNLKLKKDLILEVKNFKSSGNDEKDFEILRDFQRRWTEIGHVPIADKNIVQKEFRDSINVLFEKFSVEDKERNLLRFKTKMSDWKSSSRGHNKMFAERDKYVSKLKQLESDLVTLKNNIGFFANSKNAEALIKDVEQKIQNNEEQIVYLKDKIRVIDDIEYNEE